MYHKPWPMIIRSNSVHETRARLFRDKSFDNVKAKIVQIPSFFGQVTKLLIHPRKIFGDSAN